MTVTPEFNEQVLDTNQDGLIDKLILTPTITVPTAGDYMANVQLFDRSGVQIESTGTGEIHLAAGSQPLPLEFDGTFIYKSGQWGPYTPRVTIVYFGPVTKIVLSDAQLDDTQAYDYVQFQHDRIAVDPESLSSKAVDTDGDGLYDELDIGGTVTVETPGEYDVNSGLYGGTSFDQIAAEYMTFQFVAGANSFTLVYKGSDIAKSGQDGPYTLFDLLVYLSADPMDPPPSIELKYVTPPFKASQFGG